MGDARRMVPADWISLLEKPQCSQWKDMTMTSRKKGIEVSSIRVLPY